MIIKQLKLKQFGKFKERTIELHPNMSLVYGKGDSGKTTLLAFIRCMLYGMDAADRQYIPMEGIKGDRCCQGSVVLETADRVYQIDRDFLSDTIQIKDMATNQEIANPEVVMAAIMADITREDFDCVFGLRQQKVTYNDVNNLRDYADAVQKKISGSHLDDQIEKIKEEMLEWEGKIDENVQQEYNDCVQESLQQKKKLEMQRQEVDEIRQDLEKQDQRKKDAVLILDVQRKNLSEPLRKINETLEEQAVELNRLEQLLRYRKPTERPAAYCLILFLLGLVGLSVYMVALRESLLLIAGVAGSVIGLVGYLFFSVHYNRYAKHWNERANIRSKMTDAQAKQEEIEIQIREAEKELEHEEEYFNELEQEWAEKNELLKEQEEKILSLADMLKEKQGMLRQNEVYESQIKDLDEKWNLLCENRKFTQEQMNRVLMNMASWYLGMFTDSHYDNLKINEHEKLTILLDGKTWNLEYMGQSTIALCALAIQLAVADVVWKSDFIPIVMDETLGDFDDERVKNIIKVLKKNGRQVILLSGHQNCLDYIKQ